MAVEEEGGLLGRIAVHYRLITMAQLEEAAQLQGRFPTKRFGEILVELGYITPQQLEKLLEVQRQAVEQMRRKAAEQRAQKAQRREQLTRPPSVPPGQPVKVGLAVAAAARGDEVSPAAVAQQSSAVSMRPSAESEKLELEPTSHAAVAAPVGAERLEVEPTSHVASSATGHASQAPPAPAPVAGPMPVAAPAPAPVAGPMPVAAPAPVPAAAEPAVTGGERQRPPVHPGATKWLQGLLKSAVEWGASDVHIHSTSPVRIRRFTHLMNLTEEPLPPAQAEKVLLSILSDFDYHRFAEAGEVDFAYAVEGLGRFRACIYKQHRGVDGVFHYIPPRPPTLAELGLPSELAKITNFHQGLVLVTGPAGCGKSSTLAALVNLINEERTDHILTIEDPIEYIHVSKRCLVNQRQTVRHTESFARALRAALREDPDVICIGELRDLETISLALSAAETGHLVLSTLHTNNAIRTINRLVGVYPPNQQSQVRTMLSESLRAVISQRLMPNSENDGVVLGLEVLYVTKAVSNLMRENRTFQIHSVLQTGRSQGMRLLDLSLAELVKAARITPETAAKNAENPATFKG